MWRSLLRAGAVQLKNSVYVLPASKENRAKFEAVLKEINSGQGDAFLCESKFIDGVTNEDIVSKFNADRAKRFKELSEELREVQGLLRPKKLTENALMGAEHAIGKLERQIAELTAIDFFECKERISAQKLLESALKQLTSLRSSDNAKVEKKSKVHYQGKIWVTRKDIHEDRMASAWLISKYIDKKPNFKFVSDSKYNAKKNEVRFDMFDAEFTHIGDKCTFEVLVEAFSIEDRSVNAIAEIIHDLDLGDTKFNRPETPGIQMVIQGIVRAEDQDDVRIEKASQLFSELELSLRSQKTK